MRLQTVALYNTNTQSNFSQKVVSNIECFHLQGILSDKLKVNLIDRAIVQT